MTTPRHPPKKKPLGGFSFMKKEKGRPICTKLRNEHSKNLSTTLRTGQPHASQPLAILDESHPTKQRSQGPPEGLDAWAIVACICAWDPSPANGRKGLVTYNARQ